MLLKHFNGLYFSSIETNYKNEAGTRNYAKHINILH